MLWRKWKKMDKGTKVKVIKKGGGGNSIYCLAGLGVLIYYLNTAHSATEIILAFIKAVFWPAFISYHVYGQLGMH